MTWLEYANQNAIRNDPLSPELVQALSFLPEMGIRMRVISGGQENNTDQGTGSTRHNQGNAADVEFILSDGTVLDGTNPEHRPIIGDIVQRARANAVHGWGWGEDYMGPTRFHAGFGTPAVWGAGGRSANVDDWFREVYESGYSGDSVSTSNIDPARMAEFYQSGYSGDSVSTSNIDPAQMAEFEARMAAAEGADPSNRGRAPAASQVPEDSASFIERLADSSAYLDLAGLSQPRRQLQPDPYVVRGRQGLGSAALSRMGLASLAQ